MPNQKILTYFMILVYLGLYYWSMITYASLVKKRTRNAQEYPDVDPDLFKVWHKADIRATIAQLIASVGGVAMGILAILIWEGWIVNSIIADPKRYLTWIDFSKMV